MDGRASTLALVDQVDNNRDSVRENAANAMDQLFMVVEDLGSYGSEACCIVLELKVLTMML